MLLIYLCTIYLYFMICFFLFCMNIRRHAKYSYACTNNSNRWGQLTVLTVCTVILKMPNSSRLHSRLPPYCNDLSRCLRHGLFEILHQCRQLAPFCLELSSDEHTCGIYYSCVFGAHELRSTTK